ncbi:MAG: DUF4126 domain-containing protein [Bacteroidetes bacterium]|nr:DUF4126 domain-containing protein [Bacteroidota bacterium]MCL5026662.1 DUF4126 domain-containing protein [Chloroflexota bacterium]
MEAITNLAAGFSLAAVAGLNAYIPLLLLGMITRATKSDLLASPYDLLSNTWVLVLLFLLLMVEVLADKLPGIDTLNDTVQTVVRPVAGGILMLALAAPVDRFPPLLALGVGIAAAGVVHTAKVGFRPMVTVHSNGQSVPMVSAIEDLVATVGVFLAMVMPLANALITPLLLGGLFWGLHHQWERRVEEQTQQTPPELLS